MYVSWLRRPSAFLLTLLFICTSVLTSCGEANNTGTSSGGPVTITLAAPNQWTDSGTDFGAGWDTAIAGYEKLNSNVKVKIVVLPLSSFYQTTSTQLAAGTGPDIVFNQATYKGYMVQPLDSYLAQPNPYAPERGKWSDWFDPKVYGPANADSLAPINDGHVYWVPLNLFDAGLYYNKDIFTKAGVTAPLKTWEDWRAANKKLKAAGYVPLAMDNSVAGVSWTFRTISNMLLAKYYDQWNVFDAQGKPGKNDTLTPKDITRAIKTGSLNAKLPEFVETLNLMKEVFSQDVTPNWSGIKGLSGAGVGLPDFIAGKAAMAWGANFGAGDVGKASFQVGSMGWPTITQETSPLSTNFPAQFGVATGGTSYMIPATTKGDHLKYAVNFLQYMTAPKYAQQWITTTTGVPSVQTIQPPAIIAGFSTGDWGTPQRQYATQFTELTPDLLQSYQQIIQGWLLEKTNLADTQAAFTTAWQAAVAQQLKNNPSWASEDWAK